MCVEGGLTDVWVGESWADILLRAPNNVWPLAFTYFNACLATANFLIEFSIGPLINIPSPTHIELYLFVKTVSLEKCSDQSALPLTQRIPCSCSVIFCVYFCRYHSLNRYIIRYISYGRHDGNEFHYNDTLKMLSVSYFGEPQHKHYI